MEPNNVKLQSNLVNKSKSSGRKMSSNRSIAMTMGDTLKEKQVCTVALFLKETLLCYSFSLAFSLLFFLIILMNLLLYKRNFTIKINYKKYHFVDISHNYNFVLLFEKLVSKFLISSVVADVLFL